MKIVPRLADHIGIVGIGAAADDHAMQRAVPVVRRMAPTLPGFSAASTTV